MCPTAARDPSHTRQRPRNERRERMLFTSSQKELTMSRMTKTEQQAQDARLDRERAELPVVPVERETFNREQVAAAAGAHQNSRASEQPPPTDSPEDLRDVATIQAEIAQLQAEAEEARVAAEAEK